MASSSTLPPVRRQYLRVKANYPDALLLFRMGDFYEAFDDDAHLAARDLEIALTSRTMGRNIRVPMAGVPAHALEPYLARLIRKGHKVAICEQLSDPAKSRGLVERDVVRVVTPGTVFESSLLDQAANNYLAAVLTDEVHYPGLVGLAYVDVTTGEFSATQLPRHRLLPELERVSPAEVITPAGQVSPDLMPDQTPQWLAEPNDPLKPASGPAKLPGHGDPSSPASSPASGGPILKTEGGSSFPLTQVNPASFDPDLAQEALLTHYGIQTLESFGCQSLPLVTRAAGAIVDYLSQTYKSPPTTPEIGPGSGKKGPRLAPLAVYSSDSFMALDVQTRRNLELFQAGRFSESAENRQSGYHGGRQLSLLAALDLTRTPMGGRRLRRWLGQPLAASEPELDALERRLDAVEYFVENALERARAREVLGEVADVERVLGRVQTETAGPRDLVALKNSLDTAGPLGEVLSGQRAARVDRLRSQLSPVPEVTDGVIGLVDRAIGPEPSGSLGEGNVIREGFSPELDELKSASRDARAYIASLEQRERERTGIRNLRVGYNQVFGYYLEVSKSNLGQVPDDYIRRQTLANGERYIIPELKEYESLVLNASERVEELERSLFRQVCAQVANFADPIGKLATAIASLDVFSSLAEVAVRYHYVRPSLDLSTSIVIRNGRHPVVERNLGAGIFVPNDVALSNDDARVLVLTGPNMAGKSTFIRQVAIIVLLAQIGSFVPADEATIGLVDRIFTRVGLQDDLTTGQSTFMVEMVETAAILNQATPRSLVILDEIGRGTSTYDGLSIARSVLEHIHNDPRLGCKTLFATHYHELTELARTLPGVRNFSVAVTEEEGHVVFLHRILPGGADRSYGVHVAQLAGLPRAVVNRAWEVLDELERTGVTRKGPNRGARPEPAMQMPLFQPEQPLRELLLELDVANLTPLEAINKLYELQEKAREQTG